MKITLPRIGDHIILQKPWSFQIMHEYRNQGMLDHIGAGEKQSVYLGSGEWRHLYSAASLPAGAVLSVDRYYIRKGKGEFDSITFIVHTLDGVKLKKKLRFFVSLDDATSAEFEYPD